MIELNVPALPVGLVIEDLARLMGVKAVTDCEVKTVDLPSGFGEGRINGVGFGMGIGIITYDCKFIRKTKIVFSAPHIHPAKFLYVTEGCLQHGLIEEPDTRTLELYENSIVAAGGTGGHILIFDAGAKVNLCSIEIDREKFLLSMTCDVSELVAPLKEIFHHRESKNSFHYCGGYNLKVYDMLRDKEVNTDKGLVKQLFLMSTASGVLSEQISQYESDLNHIADAGVLWKNDMELVQRAVSAIRNNMDRPMNIDLLARKLGSKAELLQQSFKMMYGTTVNDYVKNMRITEAANLLVSTNKNISDIVKEIGLVNRGYFSKLFKLRYGCTAKEYRMKVKQNYYDKENDSPKG